MLTCISVISLFIAQIVDAEWLQSVKERNDPRAKEWYDVVLKEKLKEIKPDKETQEIVNTSKKFIKKQCRVSDSIDLEEQSTPLLVAMTFDLSDQVWLDLSSDVQRVGGAFILRGLPNNSFSELARQLKRLVNKGVYARILIDPSSFERYRIDFAPTFIVTDGAVYDKLTGAVSLLYALEKMALEGDSISAKQCLNRLKNNEES